MAIWLARRALALDPDHVFAVSGPAHRGLFVVSVVPDNGLQAIRLGPRVHTRQAVRVDLNEDTIAAHMANEAPEPVWIAR